MTDWYTDHNTSLGKDWMKQDVKDASNFQMTVSD